MLVLLYGFDELVTYNNNEDNKRITNIVVYILEKFKHVILTSRPNAVKEGALEHVINVNGQSKIFTKFVENLGFGRSERYEYIRKYEFQPDDKDSLIEFIDHDDEVTSICDVPLNVEILCYLWTDENNQKQLNDYFTRTTLYELIEAQLRKWYKSKKEDSFNNDEYSQVIRFIENLSLQSLNKGHIRLIPKQIIEDHLTTENVGDQDVFIKRLEECGFLYRLHRVSNSGIQDHFFSHKTFQEYFAAKCLLRLLSGKAETEWREASVMISQKKYKSDFREILKFMAGFSMKYSITNRFWTAIISEQDEGHVVSGR